MKTPARQAVLLAFGCVFLAFPVFADDALIPFDVKTLLLHYQRETTESKQRAQKSQEDYKLYQRKLDEVDHLIQQVAREVPDFSTRIEVFSHVFLGVPFKWGPMGEGSGPAGVFDSDPLMNFQCVDCVTFVEQTMAMACARDLKSMQRELNRIRYKKGNISYVTRNHFPEADWLPNNIAAGYLKDVTAGIAGGDVKTAVKTIKKKDWYLAKSVNDLKGPQVASLSPEEKTRRVEQWRKLGEGMDDAPASVSYIPMDKLPFYIDNIPSGVVVSVVREDSSKTPVLISHQGFFIRKDGAAFFRHANFNNKVVDTPFLEYFYKYYNSNWRVIGLNFALPQDPQSVKKRS